MTQTSTPSLARGLASVYGDVVSPEILKTSLHLLVNLPVGVFSFTMVVFLTSMTLGLLVLFPIAVLISLLLWGMVVGMNTFERLRFRGLLDVDIPPLRRPPVQLGFWARARWWLTDGATWRSYLYLLLLLPLGILTFTLALVVWVTPVGLIVASAEGFFVSGIPWFILVITGLLGVGLLAFIPYPIRALAQLNRAIGPGLLGPSHAERLEEEVTRLDVSRSRIVETADDERRRIERDLHDGAQQRLVSLAMSLGMAKEKLETDMDGAKELVEEAHVQTKRALAELRDLARGIHPALLSERGLEAALTPLAALSPIPVSLSVRVDERPGERVETVAYFVVGEALANISKHARATKASVTIVREDDRLVVEVSDDGVGGAAADGPGLNGLRNRVETIDGWFSVTSPEGGPTTIMAELPCS